MIKATPSVLSRFGTELAIHALGLAITFAFMWVLLDLKHVDLHYPMATHAVGDGIYYSAQAKILLETGWVYHHPDLGAPYGLYLYDFAHFDALHLLIMKLIGLIVPEWAFVLNMFFLLTFLFSTTTSLALFLALIFTLQPHHFYRNQGHIMLTGYYHLPLMAFALIWLLQPLGLRDSEQASLWRSRRFWVAGGFALLGTFGGHYYVAFACMGYLVAAAHSSLSFRRWAPLVQAGILVSIVGIGFTLNLIPNILYWAREGGNREVSAKYPSAAEVNSLRLVRLLMPHAQHYFPPARKLAADYAAISPFNKYEHCGVGLAASVGILGLLGIALFGRRRVDEPLSGLAVVTMVAILFTTTSGFGAVFAYLVSPQLHAMNRIAIYLAMLSLVAIGVVATQILNGMHRPWLWHVGVVMLGTLGIVDLLPCSNFYDPARYKAEFQVFERFGESIQETVPLGTMIYTLPSSRFPFDNYNYFRPFLYTKGLRWTDPAVLNRRASVWHQVIETLPADAFLEQLALSDVGGLVLDTKAKKNPLGSAVHKRLLSFPGMQPIESGEGLLFFDLRDYTAHLRQSFTHEQWLSKRTSASHLLNVRWGSGFQPRKKDDKHADGMAPRWCTATKGRVELINTGTEPVEVTLLIKVQAGGSGVRLTGKILPRKGIDVPDATLFESRINLPPGKTQVTLHARCNTPASNTETEQLWFQVDQFVLQPIGSTAQVVGR